MPKTATVRARIEPGLKRQAEGFFTTQKTFKETDADQNLVVCKNIDDMF
jgi:hypothetical protein